MYLVLNAHSSSQQPCKGKHHHAHFTDKEVEVKYLTQGSRGQSRVPVGICVPGRVWRGSKHFARSSFKIFTTVPMERGTDTIAILQTRKLRPEKQLASARANIRTWPVWPYCPLPLPHWTGPVSHFVLLESLNELKCQALLGLRLPSECNWKTEVSLWEFCHLIWLIKCDLRAPEWCGCES